MSKSLNTTAKGDAFEKKVYDIISNLLSKNEFPANCRYSSVYHKHKLYSKEEGKDVIFDIVVETTMPNSDAPSMIYIIECKDYQRAVSVDRVRNLAYQMNEVGANKGFIFTTSNFQSGVYEIAKTRHIGLVKVSENNALDWILHKSVFNKRHNILTDIRNYVLSEEPQANKYSFAAISGNRTYGDIVSFLESEMNLNIQQKRNIKYLTDDKIVDAIYDYTSLTKDTHKPIVNEQLLSIIEELGFQYQQSEHIAGIAGNINLANNTITVSNEIKEGSPHWRFTIAHEIGHIILHGIVLKLSDISEFKENPHNDWGTKFSKNDIERIEHQANLFAIALLMPKEEFNMAYANYYKQYPFRRFPYLLLDNQPCNIQMCNAVFHHIAKHFDVSAECVKHYMSNNNLLTIKDNTTSTYELFRKK